MGVTVSIFDRVEARNASLVPILLGPICYGLEVVGLMIDNFNFLSVADLNALPNNFKSVFQFRPYIGVFDSVPTFVNAMGWDKIFFLSETFQMWEMVEDTVSKGLQQFNITVGGSGKVTWTSTASIPEYKYYLEAASDLKSRNARIVIILSSFPPLMACSLYDVGMYGPKYVYIFEGVLYFQSNDQMRFIEPTCTQHKLAEILRSSIFISQATPMNLDLDFVSQLGMTPRTFDELMKKGLDDENAHARKTWFQWRANFYSQLVGTALVLQSVDLKLKSLGSTIGQWLTDGDNFQTNASFIRNLLHNEFSHFKYKGINTYGKDYITKPVLEAGFQQMQQQNLSSDSPSSFTPVSVAFYPGITGELTMMKPFQWKTKNNKIPVASISEIETWVSLLPPLSKYIIFSLSVITLIIVCGLSTFLIVGKNQSTDVNFNLTIAIGNGLASIFIIILTIVDFPSPISCSVASVFLITSQWIVNCSVLIKLELARAQFDNNKRKASRPSNVSGKNNKLTSSSITVGTGSARSSTSFVGRNSLQIPESDQVQSQQINLKKKRSLQIVTVLTLIFGLMAIIWFIVDPMKARKVFIRSQMNDEDDIYLEEVSKTCVQSEATFTAFLIVFTSPFALLLIRMIQIGFCTKHIKDNVIPKITIMRTTAYAVASISMFGVATIILLFASQPVQLLTAILALVLIIVIVNVCSLSYLVLSR